MSNELDRNENLRQRSLKRKDLTLEQRVMINSYYDSEIIRINEDVDERSKEGPDEAQARTRRSYNKKRGSVR